MQALCGDVYTVYAQYMYEYRLRYVKMDSKPVWCEAHKIDQSPSNPSYISVVAQPLYKRVEQWHLWVC